MFTRDYSKNRDAQLYNTHTQGLGFECVAKLNQIKTGACHVFRQTHCVDSDTVLVVVINYCTCEEFLQGHSTAP